METKNDRNCLSKFTVTMCKSDNIIRECETQKQLEDKDPA